MNSGDIRDAVPDLSDRLADLERERRRLAELTAAYRTVESSKFAQLRALGADARALLARTHNEPALRRVKGRAAKRTAENAAVVIERLMERLTLARTAYLDAIEALHAERTRSLLDEPYRQWTLRFGTRDIDLQRARELVPILPRRPVFSVILPTYDTPEAYLRAAIESVRAQIYPDWELCIADDASPDPRVRPILEEYARIDPRIKVTFRTENGQMSVAMNSAMASATGEFICYLDHDDLYAPEALFECALVANRIPDVDMMYSDEDKFDDSGRFWDPFFKPDWNPDTFLSRMYTCHLAVYRRSLAVAMGGMRPELYGSQDYDFVLRLSERTDRIHHIAKILYHWRVHPDSTATNMDVKPYTTIAAERAIGEALERRGEPGTVAVRPDAPGTYIVRYAIRERKKVSIIMPTRNHGEDVDRCLGSIFEKTTYDDFEIVLVDNGSDDKASLQTFEKWRKYDRRVRVLRYDIPFNFSLINNYAVAKTDGYYVLLLNNDTEVISTDWMEGMVEQAQRPSIGAVGPLLLYPDGTIQHAGVIIGLGGVAGHSHKYFDADAPGYFYTLRAINNFSAVTAACLMLRRSVYDEVGGMDKDFAVAFNDVDFCLKIRKAGYRNVYLPHVKLYHFESKSRGIDKTQEQIARFQREIQIMHERWGTVTHVDPCYSPHLTRDLENYSIRIT
jgi:glycosyltransferase involved in cell wall biosynthesis